MKKISKPYLIIGLGATGLSAYEILSSLGSPVYAYDDTPSVEAKEKLGDQLVQYDEARRLIDTKEILLVPSPGISFHHPLLTQAHLKKHQILSDIELGLQLCSYDKIIGVTGTNGKTTVGGMIHHIASQSGINSVFAGNNGLPVTKLAGHHYDLIVLELSSYQLDLCQNKFLDISIITSLAPDHLDRYENYPDYCKSKASITKRLKSPKPIILSPSIDISLLGLRLSSINKPRPLNSYLPSPCSKIDQHNWTLAFTAIRSIYPNHLFDYSVVNTYKKEAHRYEYIDTINNIHFINDSKATNPEAVEVALQECNSNIHLIMGGVLKSSNFTSLNAILKEKRPHIYLFGQNKNEIADLIDKSLIANSFDSLEDATRKAYEKANPNDTILLSPACSSFDQFKNFKERGINFKKIVESLKNGIWTL